MYACATETIYAMFIQDSFGYGERVFATLLAFCGLFIGLFQVFLIKPLVGAVGKHGMLAVGNAILAAGLVGVALVRDEWAHFALFVTHIVGYTVADTALVSLITRYSSPQSQGRDLSLNQAAQSVGRVLSPLVAGILYERSKLWGRTGILPPGALPFLVAAVLPAIGVVLPCLLLFKSRARKQKAGAR
ncbi:MAG: MFS transporter [Chitinophagia bacterium]|nr:MFS transporter [Chitinophagia bacterium]